MNSAMNDQNVARVRFGTDAHQPIKRRELIDVAMGKTPAEIVIQGGRLINVATAEIYPADVAIKGGRIAAVGDVALHQRTEHTRNRRNGTLHYAWSGRRPLAPVSQLSWRHRIR